MWLSFLTRIWTQPWQWTHWVLIAGLPGNSAASLFVWLYSVDKICRVPSFLRTLRRQCPMPGRLSILPFPPSWLPSFYSTPFILYILTSHWKCFYKFNRRTDYELLRKASNMKNVECEQQGKRQREQRLFMENKTWEKLIIFLREIREYIVSMK